MFVIMVECGPSNIERGPLRFAMVKPLHVGVMIASI